MNLSKISSFFCDENSILKNANSINASKNEKCIEEKKFSPVFGTNQITGLKEKKISYFNIFSSLGSSKGIGNFIPYACFIFVVVTSLGHSYNRITKYYPLDESEIFEGIILGGEKAIKWIALVTLVSTIFRFILKQKLPSISNKIEPILKRDIETNFSRSPKNLYDINTYFLRAISAFLEEVLFRGGFTDILNEHMVDLNICSLQNSSLITKLFVNIIFSLHHPERNLFHTISFFCLGWQGSDLREQTQNLWASSFFHTFSNILSLILKNIDEKIILNRYFENLCNKYNIFNRKKSIKAISKP